MLLLPAMDEAEAANRAMLKDDRRRRALPSRGHIGWSRSHGGGTTRQPLIKTWSCVFAPLLSHSAHSRALHAYPGPGLYTGLRLQCVEFKTATATADDAPASGRQPTITSSFLF